MNRRWFVKLLATLPAAQRVLSAAAPSASSYSYAPGRIVNEYSLVLPGEREALDKLPDVATIVNRTVKLRYPAESLMPGAEVNGWHLLDVLSINGTDTAVFEKTVSHCGAIVYITEVEGLIIRIPTGVGVLSNIKPRAINTQKVRFIRESPYKPGPDRQAAYILNSNEDPCYENVAALGPEYIGWSLVANEQAGPLHSLFLMPDGKSRELMPDEQHTALWAPDVAGTVFDPADHLPDKYPDLFRYTPGFSKRTVLGGFIPAAHTGVWNPETKSGYEVLIILSPGEEAKPMARVRALIPGWTENEFAAERSSSSLTDRFWNATSGDFYSELAGIANRWQHFFEDRMQVDIPDPWLLNSARAGIALARCSYRGLHPTYQVGEGGYTKIPERSHALFPVAHYEFIWAHQLWNLTAESDPYFQFYLDNYILPDGNFLYNTQDQVEGPLNTGIFLWNSARAYYYTHDISSLQKRLPVLRRMIDYVLARYQYSLDGYPESDRRHGLIWGSPEADLGDPHNDFPNSHPYYFQNSAWTWRGLNEHARSLTQAGRDHNVPDLEREGQTYAATAQQMRALIEKSIAATIAAGNQAMRAAGITPFEPNDINRQPAELSSYENHRFMMDWFTADWGNSALDLGHLKHREIAGLQICGLHTDGAWARTSNFMAHGTLAARIRQDDYRPFLLTLYALCCYAADSGNRYSPEDALLPGSCPGEGSRYGWSATVNSVLQPTLGLRWLLCYEESDQEICHIQKAAPKHWFTTGKRIHVHHCPTRFGEVSWITVANTDAEWQITLGVAPSFSAQLVIHLHPPDGKPLTSATTGNVQRNRILIDASTLRGTPNLQITVRS